jgi:predicted GIY-YIG superfamily endonuclease
VSDCTDLYRFFDKDDRLLYVGISLHAATRASSHKKDKPWWDDVDRMTVVHLATREAAEQAERTAIRTEKPLHNVIHNGKHQRRTGAPPAQESPRRLPWPAGNVYAFGLKDGDCPVGLVHDVWLPEDDFPFMTLEVDLYSWLRGLFDGPTITIPVESISRSCKAEYASEHGQQVFQMDALSAFQTRWLKRHERRVGAA